MTKCWQYEWKRPQFEKEVVTTTTNGDDGDVYASKECLDMSCASLEDGTIVTMTLYQDDKLQYIVLQSDPKNVCWKWPKSLNNDPLSFVQFCYTTFEKQPQPHDLDIHQAFDLLNQLSFQPKSNNHKYTYIQPKTHQQQHPETKQQEEEEDEEKVLTVCCTTRHGSVYFYPLQSLLPPDTTNKTTNKPIMRDASWILGTNLQSILSNQYLHWNTSACLSQTQVQLSDEQIQKNSRNKYFADDEHTINIQKVISSPNYLILISTITTKTDKQENDLNSPPPNTTGTEEKENNDWWKQLFQKQLMNKQTNEGKAMNEVEEMQKHQSIIDADTVQKLPLEGKNNENSPNDWWLETNKSSSSSMNMDVEEEESTFIKEEEKAVVERDEHYQSCCYVHFISLQYLSEVACVTVPIEEVNVAGPILYQDQTNMQFLIITGKNSLKESYAIRMDTLSTLGISSDDDDFIMISKFIPISLQFPLLSSTKEHYEEVPLSVGSIFTNPPCILTATTYHSDTSTKSSMLGLYTLNDFEIDHNDYLIWNVHKSPQHYAPLPSNKIDWCLTQQGCSFVGNSQSIYFISWEGATISNGAYVQTIHTYLNSIDTDTDTKLFCRAILPKSLTQLAASKKLIVNDTNNTNDNILTNENASFWELPKLPSSNGTKINHSIPNENPASSSKVIKIPSIQISTKGIEDKTNEESFYFGLGSRQRSTGLLDDHDNDTQNTNTSDFDDIITDALDSVKNIPLSATVEEHHSLSEDSTTMLSLDNDNNFTSSLCSNSDLISHQLLHKCTSWTQLDDTKENRDGIDRGQQIVGLIHLSSNQKGFVSLRKNVLDNGHATPFEQVLTWLCCQKKDYVTAASIAFHLLHDYEAIRGLRSSSIHTNTNFALSSAEGNNLHDQHNFNLEGLLDGIVPLDKNDFLKAEKLVKNSLPKNETNPDDSSLQDNVSLFSIEKKGEKSERGVHNIITSLADMAVGCMVRGGADLSYTLEGFLSRNPFYDASRACLMLAASIMDEIEKYDSSDKLWPVQCLLCIAVVRDCMPTALVLLNTVIPHVLRGRSSTSMVADEFVDEEKKKQLDLCRSIIVMIVSSSKEAARILLNLIEEDALITYWQSLAHETRLELSLIQVDGKFPFFFEQEVRTWALNELNASIHNFDEASTLSIPWLQKICTSCLLNAGCNQTLILQQSSTTTEDFIIDEKDDDIEQYTRDHNQLLLTLENVFNGCSQRLDFNMIIASLLILQKQGQLWHPHASVSTQSLLCFLCNFAGRNDVMSSKNDDRDGMAPLLFDGVLAMKQCGKMQNIIAGANIIGGHDGFVLKCVDIILKYYNDEQISIQIAENYLLFGGNLPVKNSRIHCEDKKTLTESHHRLLWLLETHLLSIGKYGDLMDKKRGNVNASFATRLCLRTWLALNREDSTYHNQFLSFWFGTKLKLYEPNQEKNRLACAVLARVLIWEDGNSDFDDDKPRQKNSPQSNILAKSLHLDQSFVISLSKNCCGMVESVPPMVAYSMFNCST